MSGFRLRTSTKSPLPSKPVRYPDLSYELPGWREASKTPRSLGLTGVVPTEPLVAQPANGGGGSRRKKLLDGRLSVSGKPVSGSVNGRADSTAQEASEEPSRSRDAQMGLGGGAHGRPKTMAAAEGRRNEGSGSRLTDDSMEGRQTGGQSEERRRGREGVRPTTHAGVSHGAARRPKTQSPSQRSGQRLEDGWSEVQEENRQPRLERRDTEGDLDSDEGTNPRRPGSGSSALIQVDEGALDPQSAPFKSPSPVARNPAVGEHTGVKLPGRSSSNGSKGREGSFRVGSASNKVVPIAHDNEDEQRVGTSSKPQPDESFKGSFKVPELLPAPSYEGSFVKRGSLISVKSDDSRALQAALVKSVEPWKRNRAAVDDKQWQWGLSTAFFGLSGVVLAVGISEAISSHDHQEGGFLDLLKLANTVLTVLAIFSLVQYYSLGILYLRLITHVKTGRRFDPRVKLRDVASQFSFWIECIILAVHTPPWYEVNFQSYSSGLCTTYRGESIFCLMQSMRLYLLWRLIRDWVVRRFPKRQVVSYLSSMEFGNMFAFKQIVNSWASGIIIAVTWIFFMCVAGYWYYVAESDACKGSFKAIHTDLCSCDPAPTADDPFLQSSIWGMFIASTSVGYGDVVPVTNLGRLVASAMAVAGIVMIALLTAALSSALQLDPDEHLALLVLEREKARLALQKRAAILILSWWKMRKARKTGSKTTAARNMIFEARESYNRSKIKTRVDVEECAADSAKIDQVAMRMRYIRLAVDTIQDKIGLFGVEDFGSFVVREDAKNGVSTAVYASVSSSSNNPDGTSNEFEQEVEKRRLHAQPSLARLPSDGSAKEQPSRELTRASTLSWQNKKLLWDELKCSRLELSNQMSRESLLLAFFGLVGSGFAVAQNEMVFSNYDPNSSEMNFLKFGNTACTIIATVSLGRYYAFSIAYRRLEKHITVDMPLSKKYVSFLDLCKRWRFWLEIVINIIHLPPFCTFELEVVNLRNFILYRAETVFCSWNMLRLYLLLRVFREWALSDLPRRHTVELIAGVRLGTRFALLRMLHGMGAVIFLAWIWALCVFVAGYLYRSAENTACQFEYGKENPWCMRSEAQGWVVNAVNVRPENDVYLTNSLWLAFITSTTVGYGDIEPKTHSGRFAASVVALVGIVMASMLAASLVNTIRWSPVEQFSLLLLKMQEEKDSLQERAAKILGLWWRFRQAPKKAKPRILGAYRQAVKRFRQAVRSTQMPIEDFEGSSAKIEKIVRQSKYIKSAVEIIGARLETIGDPKPDKYNWMEKRKESRVAGLKHQGSALDPVFEPETGSESSPPPSKAQLSKEHWVSERRQSGVTRGSSHNA